MKHRRVVIGNWKMHCPDDPEEVATRIAIAAKGHPVVRVVICPPYTLLASIEGHLGSVGLGAQDCHFAAEGPFTGGVSAALLRRAGVRYVLVGHSERRGAGDDDATVRAKAENAIAAGLTPVICVGETGAEHDAGQTHDRLAQQVAASLPEGRLLTSPMLAYEPVWAIGTKVTPNSTEIEEASMAIRQTIAGRGAPAPTILYGGSVTASNSGRLAKIRGIDGLLVGKASLDPDEFTAIIASAR